MGLGKTEGMIQCTNISSERFSFHSNIDYVVGRHIVY